MIIGIIVVLLALLLPVMARASVESQSVVCKSNLRQLGTALRMYFGDSDGFYPYSASFPASNPKGVSHWFDALALNIPRANWGEGVFSARRTEVSLLEGKPGLMHKVGSAQFMLPVEVMRTTCRAVEPQKSVLPAG